LFQSQAVYFLFRIILNKAWFFLLSLPRIYRKLNTAVMIRRVTCCLALIFSFVNTLLYGQTGEEKQFLTRTRQLVLDGKRSGEGYFSQDGKKMIFQAEREPDNPFYQIYILDLESGETHRVSPGQGKTTCAFFRWGGYDEVMFGSTHADPKTLELQKAEIEFRNSGQKRRYAWDYDPNMDIYTAKQDGSGLKRLTNAFGYDAEGAYSPDGSKIVFSSMRDAYADNATPEDISRREKDPAYYGEVYIMNADGSDQKRLTYWHGYDGGTFFSPDGQRILFRHFNEEGTIADAYTIKIDGTDLKRITDFGSMSWAPFYHPSGEYIIFASNKLGFSNFELFIVDKDGEKEPVRITQIDGFDGLAVFTPDGKRLSWTSSRTPNGNAQIFIADWNHANALDALKKAPPRVKHYEMKLPFKTLDGNSSNNLTTNQLQNNARQPALTVGNEQVNVQNMAEIIRYLASDELEGRMTGSKGEKLASDYISKYFEQIGLQKWNSSFLNPFEFSNGYEVIKEATNCKVLEVGKERSLDLNKDFVPLVLSESGTAQGKIVFAGYGIKTSGKKEESYNSFADVDVKDKIVVVLTDFPKEVDDKRKNILKAAADPRFKAMNARELGAKGILFVSSDPNKTLYTLKSDNSLSSSGIIAASIDRKVLEEWLKLHDKSYETVKKNLDSGNPSLETSFDLHRLNMTLNVGLLRKLEKANNIVGYLPPANASNDYIIVGAHYDHLGKGDIESASLAHGKHHKQIHNGADDNASGTAMVMELAKHFAQLRASNPSLFKKGIIFGLWSGEELGLVGSKKLLERCPVQVSQLKAQVNFDMVGSLKDNKLIITGVGSASEWNKMFEKRNIAAGFDLALQADPYVPTDATNFYLKGIPAVSFFTGVTPYYHTPDDDFDKINIEGMGQILPLAQNVITDLISSEASPTYIKVESNASMSGKRKNNNVYLGTIPDYVSSEKGAKLSGVKANSPAEKGGLQGGDLIIELAGKKVDNVYDYTYILDSLEVGKAVKAVVIRNGQKVELSLTPGTRE